MGTDQLTDSLTVTILRTTDDDGAAMALDSLSTVELRVYRVHGTTSTQRPARSPSDPAPSTV